MSIVLSYLVKSTIASGLLYLYYHLALRNKRFHAYNRFYLLASVVISLIVPLANFEWFYIQNPQSTPINSILVAVNPAQPQHTTNTLLIPLILMAFVSLSLITILTSKIAWIYSIKRKYKNTLMQSFTLIETPVKQAPFSFLSNLFWKEGMALDNDNGHKIFSHELTHIKQKHTYDKLLTQITVCIFWMNPFYWLIQKELTVVHEFIADAGCIEDGDTESFARMLLQSHNEGRYLNPSHAFFNSSIKRRLIMITTSKHTAYSYARRVLALPLVLCLLAIFSVRVSRAQTDPKLDSGGVKVTKATFIKQGNGDSVISVKVQYINKDGKPDTLTIHNVHINYSPAEKHHGDSLRVYNNHVDNNMFSVLATHPAVKNIEAGSKQLTVYLKNGSKEVYDATDEEQVKSFSEKYQANILKLDDVESQRATPAENEIFVQPAEPGGKKLRVYNISKLYDGQTQKVITTKPEKGSVHVIKAVNGKVIIDTVPVWKAFMPGAHDPNEHC